MMQLQQGRSRKLTPQALVNRDIFDFQDTRTDSMVSCYAELRSERCLAAKQAESRDGGRGMGTC